MLESTTNGNVVTQPNNGSLMDLQNISTNPVPSNITNPVDTNINPTETKITDIKKDIAGILPDGQKDQQNPNQKESYFQKNWDALANVCKENGLALNLSDTPNYTDILKPYFESHKTIEYMQKNPNTILDLAEKYFPDRINKPTFDTEVKELLAKEFGDDFTVIPEDLFKPGTDSYRYRNKMQEIESSIRTREENKIKQQEQEALQRQGLMRQEFETQYKQAMTDLNMTDEQIKPYVQKVISGDPKYSTMTNMIKMIMLADGEIEAVPKDLPDNKIIASIGSAPGGTPSGTPKSVGDWVGLNL